MFWVFFLQLVLIKSLVGCGFNSDWPVPSFKMLPRVCDGQSEQQQQLQAVKATPKVFLHFPSVFARPVAVWGCPPTFTVLLNAQEDLVGISSKK